MIFRDAMKSSGRFSLALFLVVFTLVSAQRRVEAADPPRCLAVELYLVGDSAQQAADREFVEKVLDRRAGVALRQFQVETDDKAQKRFEAICRHYKLPLDKKHALVYACNQPAVITGHDEKVARACDSLFRFEIFVRTGCSRCKRALPWVRALVAETPALNLEIHDVITDPSASAQLSRHAQEHGTRGTSFPACHFCGELVVGWDSEQTTGKRIRNILAPWTVSCPSTASERPKPQEPGALKESRRPSTNPRFKHTTRLPNVQPPRVAWHHTVAEQPRTRSIRLVHAYDPADEPSPAVPSGVSPMPGEDSDGPSATDVLPLPGEAEGPSSVDGSESDEIELPWLGKVRVSRLGLPLFTLSVGLIDGFNPCAMWVLVFLLSVLVNLKSRPKMLAVAGTFVVVSGVAYYAFIAAWLNVFEWVGLLRWVQVLLAGLAIFIGSVHVKDFFALHRGLTLSIPESAKPGIYARVRAIVNAESLWGALVGAIVLAVLVNFVELLCTAGLPALYSQVLTMQQLPAWQEYLYLGLYILAYMFDDTLMVLGVVATLGRPKMQEVHGRWLKLLSGSVILALGLIMLFRPQWLG